MRLTNATVGDIVLTQNPSPYIQPILSQAGLDYTHVIMITGDAVNPGDSNTLSQYTTQNEEDFLVDHVQTLPPKIKTGFLDNIPPGSHPEDWDTYSRHQAAHSAMILKPVNRGPAVAAANTFVTNPYVNSGKYKISEFSNS